MADAKTHTDTVPDNKGSLYSLQLANQYCTEQQCDERLFLKPELA